MDGFSALVRDASLLVAHAASHRVVLQPADRERLVTADPERLRSNPAEHLAFLGALDAVSQALGVSAAELRATTTRTDRLRPLVTQALTLLDFAAANARPVSDDIRMALTQAASAVAAGGASAQQEQEFLKAYEALTLALAPITAETLEVSTTRLPTPSEFLRGLRGASTTPWTLGRFVNATIFLLALIGTGVALAYYHQGASALALYRDLQKAAASLKDKETAARLEVADRESALATAKQRELQSTARLDDTQDVGAAMASRDRALAKLDGLVAERAAVDAELLSVPERLGAWAMQPCTSRNPVFNLALCASTHESQLANPAPDALHRQPRVAVDLAAVEAARTVISRLNDVYLPLLLGFLGAHAYILRRMSQAISERAFARGSAFNHIVRVGLGALAGLASTWLLTPDVVGGASFKALPIWALAFVAGYGIELVFAFMDRLIAAFTAPTR